MDEALLRQASFTGMEAEDVTANTGEDPQEAVRAALALHAYEIAFWDTLADGLG